MENICLKSRQHCQSNSPDKMNLVQCLVYDDLMPRHAYIRPNKFANYLESPNVYFMSLKRNCRQSTIICLSKRDVIRRQVRKPSKRYKI